jgi:hypothetical protein
MMRLAYEWGLTPHVSTIHELPGGKGRANSEGCWTGSV